MADTAPEARRRAEDIEPVIEAYRRGVDVSLIRDNLACSVEERFRRLMALQRLRRGAATGRASGAPGHVTDFAALLQRLGEAGVEFVLVGGGRYEDLLPHTVAITLLGVTVRCLDLDRLIDVKRAAGRPKDLEAIAELEAPSGRSAAATRRRPADVPDARARGGS